MWFSFGFVYVALRENYKKNKCYKTVFISNKNVIGKAFFVALHLHPVKRTRLSTGRAAFCLYQFLCYLIPGLPNICQNICH